MEQHAFRLEALNIRKVPGFPDGLQPYKEFASGLNIIAGPNASGKSTTARAIQKLIWRNETGGLHIDARARIADELWTIHIDSGLQQTQRNGIDDELAGLPAAEDRSQYMLALHDLISDDEEDLARRIIQASIGGYDPDQAHKALSYSSSIKTIGTNEYREFKEADKAYQEQRDKQADLKKDEEKLEELYRQKQQAEHAARLQDLYERVSAFRVAESEHQRLKSYYDAFPGVMEKVTGEELEHIERLEQEIAEAREAVRQAEATQDQSRRQLEAFTIPPEGVSETHLNELEQRVHSLKQHKDELVRLKEQQGAKEAEKEEIRRAITDDADTSSWKGLKLSDVRELDQFFERAQRTAGEQRFLEKEIEGLYREESEDIADRDRLQQGIQLLSNWLHEPGGTSGLSGWFWFALSGMAVLTGLSAFLWSQAAIIGALILLVLSSYGLWRHYNPTTNPRHRLREEDFHQTGLTPPEAWNAEEVSSKLNELIDELHRTHRQHQLHQKLEERRSRMEELHRTLGEIEEESRNLLDRLAALPELPTEQPDQFASLHWFIVSVQKWQQAHEEAESLKATYQTRLQTYKDELQACSEIFTRYRYSEAADATGAEARFTALRKEEKQREETARNLENSKNTIESNNEVLQKRTAELEAIYEKLGIAPGDKDEVRQLINQRKEFQQAREDLQVARHKLSDAEHNRTTHPLYETLQSEANDLTQEEAQNRVETCRQQADRLEEINNNITRIETQIAGIQSENTLEEALQKRDEALDKLEGLYERNLSAITGDLLVSRIKEQTREQNRPKVFWKANEKFNSITQGRYELRLNEGDAPEFMAFDTAEQRGKTLTQLSTGTRIQLLLAVRLAFVETQESSVKLPILADELLANSDDVRARAIIDALTEISKEGRQVFYFTAQTDEVAKWRARLAETSGIDFEVFELPGHRGTSAGYQSSPEDLQGVRFHHEVPAVDGQTYEEYGEAIGVPPFDLLLHESSQLHLWYLLDDADLLRRCLQNGIHTWGQLESFIAYDGRIDGLDNACFETLKTRTRILEHFREWYRQGRSQPIDRSVLEASGAVSDKFIDQTAQKLKEHNGNPEKLIQSLRNKEVASFRSDKIGELEQYLTEQGYIDQHELLSMEEIQTRLQAVVSNSGLSPEDAGNFIRRFVAL